MSEDIRCQCGAIVTTSTICNCGRCGMPLMSSEYNKIWLNKVKKEFIKKVNKNE